MADAVVNGYVNLASVTALLFVREAVEQSRLIDDDGRDVCNLTCDNLLANFSAVFQDVYLFNDTVANDIGFGRPGTTCGKAVEAAARGAGAAATPGGFCRLRDGVLRGDPAPLRRAVSPSLRAGALSETRHAL